MSPYARVPPPVVLPHLHDSPAFVIGEEGVGDPDFLGKVPGEGEELVTGAEGESLVLPVLVEVHSDGVVLRRAETRVH